MHIDLTTLVILLIALAAAVIAGTIALYKRKHDPDYIKQVENQKNKPLMGKPQSFESYLGRRLSAIPYAILLVFILVILSRCGVV